MPYQTLFAVLNLLVMPFWLLLAIAPRSRIAKLTVHGAATMGAFSALYVLLLFSGQGPQELDFGTLAGVSEAFAHPAVALAGWVHYLTFDLFVGAWIARDAVTLGIHRGCVAPCLAFTLMVGPAGLLLYLGLRRWKAGTLELGV